MKKSILTITLLSALFVTSCKETPKEEGEKETTETTSEDVIKNSFTDNEGNKLDVTFHNTKKTATVDFNGETIELAELKAASGFSYGNDEYELSGKDDQVMLTKGEEVVFSNQDEILEKTVKDASGQEITMIFNNTKDEVTVLFKEETIEMKSQKPASGMSYSNGQYELNGKGDQVELTKDGETIFKN